MQKSITDPALLELHLILLLLAMLTVGVMGPGCLPFPLPCHHP
jgi:hypothetical protein